MRERVENEVYFATPSPGPWHSPSADPHAPAPKPTVPEGVFYAGRPRPPVEIPIAVRAAATPMRYALVVFLVGWAGILFQAGFLQQVVFGAPVFEELAKLGPALLLVVGLGIRSPYLRVPIAWISGAAFGFMEHYVTYADEPIQFLAERVAFHAISPGLSMLMFTAFEVLPDVRARWASTIPSTLFHWGNNFAAVALGVAGIFIPGLAESIGIAWSSLITASMFVLTLAGLAARHVFEARARRVLETAMPRLGLAPAPPQEQRDKRDARD